MPNGSVSRSSQMNGHSFGNGSTANQEFGMGLDIRMDLPVGNVVTAWVKTDANTAACNLTAGHGKTNGTYDVFWTIAGVNYARYGVANTITTNACALDGGNGDDFPDTATTGIVITKQVVYPSALSIDGDNVKVFLVHLTSADTAAVGSVDFQDASNASIEQLDLVEANNHVDGCKHEYVTTTAVGLLTGAVITQIKASNGSATQPAKLWVDVGVT